MPSATERQASKYVRAIEANSKGALRAVTTSKDPTHKLRERLVAVDEALKMFKLAAKVAIKERTDKKKEAARKPPANPAKPKKKKRKPKTSVPEAPPQSPRVSNDHFSLFG